MDWSDRIGRRLKPRDLHVFLAVAEQGNMAKAADTLAISRPVVSKTISDLERMLGVRLFDRSPQGVEPTLYGRALLQRSVAVFDELKRTVKEIEFLADPSAGELRIGCPEVMAAGFVGAVVNRLSIRYPNLVFHMELGTITDLQVRALRERKCEFVIGRKTFADYPDMNVEPLFYERVHVAVGLRSKWAGRRKIALRQLIDEPWILAPTEVEREGPAAKAFRAAGIDVPRTTVWSSSLNLRISLLATGRFVTLIHESVLRFSPHRTLLKVLPIEMPRWQLPVAIITIRNRTIGPIAQLCLEHARDLAKSLATDH